MTNLKSALERFFHSGHMQSLRSHIVLRDAHKQQLAAITMVAIMMLVLLSIVGYSWVKDRVIGAENRPSYFIPADINVATSVCELEMTERLGDELLRSYVDQHSTRLDDSEGIFRIYMKADIGDARDFHEIDVYCFVDKWDQSLSYYKQIDPNVKRVMTSDIQFFKN